jgi:energy-coupling factor transporter ATP-binding protein EcfA2
VAREPFSDLADWEPRVGEAGRFVEPRVGAEELRVDAHLRAGRHREMLAETQAMVRARSLHALVGPSGSGKSSILRAGVAAALRSRGRPIVAITPGPHPVEALTALGQAPPETVLLVDRREELFSLCDDPDERQQFLTSLTVEAPMRTLIVALRADLLVSNSAFSRLEEQGLYLAGDLDDDALRQAIEGHPVRLD